MNQNHRKLLRKNQSYSVGIFSLDRNKSMNSLESTRNMSPQKAKTQRAIDINSCYYVSP